MLLYIFKFFLYTNINYTERIIFMVAKVILLSNKDGEINNFLNNDVDQTGF